jgi:hypothetical protein
MKTSHSEGDRAWQDSILHKLNLGKTRELEIRK